jgi:chemotaxis protein MotD
MNKADPLTAAFRQLAAAKTTSRAGSTNAAAARDGKDKVDRFRDQLRVIAQAAIPGPKADADNGKTAVARAIELPACIAEIAEELTSRIEHRARESDEASQPAAVETAPSQPQWRGPEAALSVVISRLDRVQTPAAADDDAATPVARPQGRTEPREAVLEPAEFETNQKAEAAPALRFALSVDSAETRTLPAVKVVVRDQETHFEPVQQPTLLQKIVDRMGADLPVPTAQVGSSSAAAALPDLHKAADKPVKMLTLQLDPPDLGAVTVKMRLAGDAVEIRLSADRYETTQLLQQERGALTEMMQSAGYKFDIASIDQSHAGDANAGSGQQPPQADQRPSQQPQGGSQLNFAESERQSHGSQAGTRHNRQQHEQVTEQDRRQDKAVVGDRNNGALYL